MVPVYEKNIYRLYIRAAMMNRDVWVWKSINVGESIKRIPK